MTATQSRGLPWALTATAFSVAVTATFAVQADTAIPVIKRISTPVASSDERDPRIRKITYSADAVVTVQTRRGQVTHIALVADEQIVGEPATGHGSDCRMEASTWCVTATERDIFVKPKAGATTTNVIVVTTKRRHVFELVPIEAGPAAMRVAIVAQQPAVASSAVLLAAVQAPPPQPLLPPLVAPVRPAALSAEQLVSNRMKALPLLRNAEYSVAVGKLSEDIVPVMVWDDGQFTYLSFPGNRPIPTVFATAPDGSEEMVNVRMDGHSQLVADRVARRFLLRLGDSVVAVINEAFDVEGAPARAGTVVPGVARVMRSTASGYGTVAPNSTAQGAQP